MMIEEIFTLSPIELKRLADSTPDPIERVVAETYYLALDYLEYDDYTACYQRAFDWAYKVLAASSYTVQSRAFTETYVKCIAEKLENQTYGRIVDLQSNLSALIQTEHVAINRNIDNVQLAVINNANDNVSSIEGQITGFESQIAATLGPPVIAIEQFLTNIDTEIASILESGLIPIEAFLGSVVQNIGTEFNAILQQNDDVIESIAREIQLTFSNVTQGIESIVTSIAEDPEGFRVIIADFVLNLPEWLETNVYRPIVEGMGIEDAPSLVDWLKDFSTISAESSNDVARNFVDGLPITTLQKDGIHEALASIGTQSWVKIWYNSLTSLWLGINEFTRGKQAAAELSILMEKREIKSNRASAEELIAANTRGLLDDASYLDSIDETGLPERDISVKRELTYQRLNPAEVFHGVWRGIITEGDKDNLLKRSGTPPFEAAIAEEIARPIYGAQDLIRFMVREVFSPEISATFGLYNEYPVAVEEFADKIGIKREILELFWASHWELPGMQQAFDMFHRQLISENELQKLLRAKDVMPFWRSKLMGLSYRLITRVDIRRIHKLGQKTLEWVYEQYKKRGYTDEDATALTDFTEEYNKPRGGLDDDEFRLLTRSLTQKLYRQGVITRNTAINSLKALDYDALDADSILMLVDLESEAEDRSAVVGIVKDRFKASIITFLEAQQELSSLGLTVTEFTKSVAQLQRIQASKTKTPSYEQLNDLIGSGIITIQRYRQGLEALGYEDGWIDDFIRANT
ncbi:hypothetical protein LCGC14_1128030 [marine sediment metagenome]|uniref:Uncharacterized protein n=1 Tax=marine sediment metagenome TaxID=412755 RepID=A0A0F9Q7R9_9ZZZZ